LRAAFFLLDCQSLGQAGTFELDPESKGAIMRTILTIVFAIVALPTAMHAQFLCEQPQSTGFTCTVYGPPSCQQHVTQTVPMSSEYGVTLSPGFVSCCGQNYPAYTIAGGCQVAQMKDPAVLNRLIKISKTKLILIADCKGAYMPFNRDTAMQLQAKRYEIHTDGDRISLDGQRVKLGGQ
jgi:hypothetical protein